MKLLTGKRIGQSGRELTAAVFFSFFIHIIVLFAALFLYVQAVPRVIMPPFYRVNLVNLPADAVPVSAPQPAALPPAAVEKPKEKTAKQTRLKPTARPKPAAVRKDAMPELQEEKSKKEKTTEEAGSTSKEGAADKKQEAVVVASAGASQDPLFASYIERIRVKVEQNWNPPPGAKGTRAKVQFTVLRSGRLADVDRQESSGNFYFDQAAIRAIRAAEPFPPFPEGSFKESEVFSVDLMEKE